MSLSLSHHNLMKYLDEFQIFSMSSQKYKGVGTILIEWLEPEGWVGVRQYYRRLDIVGKIERGNTVEIIYHHEWFKAKILNVGRIEGELPEPCMPSTSKQKKGNPSIPCLPSTHAKRKLLTSNIVEVIVMKSQKAVFIQVQVQMQMKQVM